MQYNQSMSSSLKHLRSIAVSLLFAGVLGSCTTFHTPLSREYFAAGDFSEPQQDITDIPTENLADTEGNDQTLTFDWPVDRARMTRGFLPKKRKPHLGIDLAASRGTPILASQNGTVIYAGREFRGYGKMVLIESGNGWATLYAHFDKILVAEGQKVHQGEVIGSMGRTGRATGVHLHFEIRKDRGPIDPLPLLPMATASR